MVSQGLAAWVFPLPPSPSSCLEGSAGTLAIPPTSPCVRRGGGPSLLPDLGPSLVCKITGGHRGGRGQALG